MSNPLNIICLSEDDEPTETIYLSEDGPDDKHKSFEPEIVYEEDFDISLFCNIEDVNPLDDEKFDFVPAGRGLSYYSKKFPKFSHEIHQILASCNDVPDDTEEEIVKIESPKADETFTVHWD